MCVLVSWRRTLKRTHSIGNCAGQLIKGVQAIWSRTSCNPGDPSQGDGLKTSGGWGEDMVSRSISDQFRKWKWRAASENSDLRVTSTGGSLSLLVCGSTRVVRTSIRVRVSMATGTLTKSNLMTDPMAGGGIELQTHDWHYSEANR